MRPSKPVLLLALAAAVLAAVPFLSGAAEARTRTPWKVSAYTAATNVAGTPLLVHGRVAPGAKGAKVAIQVKVPGATAWRTVRKVVVRAHSVYSAKITLSKAGVNRLRVVKPAGGGHRVGASPVRAVTVSAWRSLETMFQDVPQDSATTVQSSYVLGANTFAPAYVQDLQGDRFFALNGRCSKLDVWVFADPTSTTDDNSAALILASRAADPSSYGDNLAPTQVHRTGSPVHVQLAGATVQRIASMQLYFNGFVSGNKIVWGSPKALCTF